MKLEIKSQNPNPISKLKPKSTLLITSILDNSRIEKDRRLRDEFDPFDSLITSSHKSRNKCSVNLELKEENEEKLTLIETLPFSSRRSSSLTTVRFVNHTSRVGLKNVLILSQNHLSENEEEESEREREREREGFVFVAVPLVKLKLNGVVKIFSDSVDFLTTSFNLIQLSRDPCVLCGEGEGIVEGDEVQFEDLYASGLISLAIRGETKTLRFFVVLRALFLDGLNVAVS
ncbi:unnamed protein product [Vicia faba]|uniref:Uncharacterized protein n=1 Tax=Vicia faba TaxID=3906 RepID=A0AAV1AER8_VICFA|nr:unnamed protein product [Vicia faba]